MIDRLRSLAEYAAGLPPLSVVPVDRELVLELAAQLAAPPVEAQRLGTVADLERRFGCSPSTGRAWLADGRVPGAYKASRLGWRFPLKSMKHLEEHLRRPGSDDLGAWRRKKGSAA